MTTTITRDHLFYAFDPTLAPVARIAQGEEALVETHDCFQGQIRTPADALAGLDWNAINPATGPVYIDGVKPGDVLRVDLLEVRVTGQPVMAALPGAGALGDSITQSEAAVLTYRGDKVVFKGKVELPIRPMIGVIGVAPAESRVPNGTPGPHGGNLDCTLAAAGNRLFFTAAVEGALFGCGDLHAVMGDGEIEVCGAETPGVVRFRAQAVPALAGLPTPFIETPELLVTLASALTADEAADLAIHNMALFLKEFVGLPVNDAAMLMSLAGWLKFCQVVDPLKTVRFEFPKTVLAQLDYTFPA